MTRPVEEFEISALIDGQLDPVRAAEVRAAIEGDPSLCAEYERIRAADEAWTAAAQSARFMPAVDWNRMAPVRNGILAGTVLALMLAVGRLLLKAYPIDLLDGMAVHGLILAVIIAAVVWVCGRLEGGHYSGEAGATPV